MISRQWRGLAKADRAQDYIDHLREETFPKLQALAGFIDASILQREMAEGIEFVIVTRWQSLAAVSAFAGSEPEMAVVADKVKQMMVEYDLSVRHYTVVQ
jgi:heme-degrading monooxygenase HmoA